MKNINAKNPTTALRRRAWHLEMWAEELSAQYYRLREEANEAWVRGDMPRFHRMSAAEEAVGRKIPAVRRRAAGLRQQVDCLRGNHKPWFCVPIAER